MEETPKEESKGSIAVIPPPPSNEKPVAFYDTESFANYWLLKFKPKGGAVFSFCLRAGESFDQATIDRIFRLFELFCVISFNGNYYDVPLVDAALAGYTTEQLKWLSDEIVLRERKPWELNLPGWKPPDHIDLIEVAPGSGSQKQYAGRIHCKTMRDCPFEPEAYLSNDQIRIVDDYCENDLSVLEDLFEALKPQVHIRKRLSERYGIDLRSKSDAQLGESIIKLRCEQAIGQRIYKPEIDWNIKFRYEAPRFLSFQSDELKAAFELIKNSIFTLGPSGAVEMPVQLEGLELPIGNSRYRLGIGGLHSSEKRSVYISDDRNVLRDIDVASYYPNLILNSGKHPPALGPSYRDVYRAIIDERLDAKAREKDLKKKGDTKDPNFVEGYAAHCENEGGKVAINGPFGKLGSPFSILFAPEMLIQTTVTGQLSLLMLIEWFEMQSIPVVSANTDGVVIYCPREKLPTSDSIIKYWEKTTGLEMESTEYAAIYSRDVNNYFAVYTPEDAKKKGESAKRKGEYSKAGLVEKKNPDIEICADAVAEFLSNGTPLLYTIASCKDFRKFVTVRKVTGGAVKLWGEGPRKEMKVCDMGSILAASGWIKSGRKWERAGILTDARTAYKSCFVPQVPEYLGKVIRWYYSTTAPGSIVYNKTGNSVPLSYGARPCMVLPDEFPSDIDYSYYLGISEGMLEEIGYYDVHCRRCNTRKRDGLCQNYGCESSTK